MISLSSSSQFDIKSDIDLFLQQNADRYPVLTNYSGSVKNQILDMLSGLGTFLTYKYMASWREINLSTCTSREAAYVNAAEIGYNVTRATSPVIELHYSGTSNLILTSGYIFGTYQNGGVELDVVYFGPNKTLFPGDKVSAYLGKYFKQSGDFLKFDFNKPVFLNLQAEDGFSIDQNLVNLYVNDEVKTLTDEPETFLLNGVPCAITKPRSQLIYGLGVEILLYQNGGLYGLPINKQDTYIVEWVSTQGQIQQLDSQVQVSLTLNDTFEFVQTQSYGSDSESLDQVKQLAPLYYLTARRAVTPTEYETILIKDPYISDAKYYGYNETTRSVRIAYVSSSGVPLTNYEKAQVQAGIEKRGVSGVGIELAQATIKSESVLVQILYDCASKKAVEALTSMENILKDRVLTILNGYSGKLGAKFSIEELKSKISRITLLDQAVIKGVSIRKVNPDGSISPYLEGHTFSALKTEAYNLNVRLEMSC